MQRSMYSGVSGLRAQQIKLDVIGNNISNVSTYGYKQQTVGFSDILSQKLSGATGASNGRGGTNPKQVGLGVSASAISTKMDPGSTQSTGNNRDVSIGGDGFFIVEGGSSGKYQFTRAGNFGVDESGNLTVGGMTVCGWQDYGGKAQTDGTYKYDTQKEVEPINVFSDTYNGNKRIIAPKSTTSATLLGNLDPTKIAHGTALNNIGTVPTTADATTTLTVYDSQGTSYDVQLKMYKCYTDASTAGTSTGNKNLVSGATIVAAATHGTNTGSKDLSGGVTIASGSNDALSLTVDGTTINITLDSPKSYTSATLATLASDINAKIGSTSVTASIDSNNRLIFTSTSTGSASSVAVSGTALSDLMGTATASDGKDQNNTLTLALDGEAGVDIKVAAGSYTTGEKLLAAVNTAIAGTSLNGKVTASLDSNNQLVFTSATKGSRSKVNISSSSTSNAYSTLLGSAAASDGVTKSDNTSWYWQTTTSDSKLTAGNNGYLLFDANGKIISNDTNYSTVPTITLTPTGTVNASPFTVKLDLSGVSTYTSSGTAGVKVSNIDGYASGDLQDFTISSDGVITGVYSNDQKQVLGKVALAQFSNSAGLEKLGDNLYGVTANSGDFTGGVEAGTSGTGALNSGTLEMSNVDLAEQFSEMMISSRAYQANSKIISTSDEMLQTLINMK